MVLLAGLLCFAGLSIVPVYAKGSGTAEDPVIVYDYEELRSYLVNAAENQKYYIKLGQDVHSDEDNNYRWLSTTRSSQDVILDLAGHTITRDPDTSTDKAAVEIRIGTLTIRDSKGGGKILFGGCLDNGILCDVEEAGKLIMEGGTVEPTAERKTKKRETSAITMIGSGQMIINGGIFRASIGLNHCGGNMVINGGEYYTLNTGSNAEAMQLNSGAGSVWVINATSYGPIRIGGTNSQNPAMESLWSHIYASTTQVSIDGTVKQKPSEAEKKWDCTDKIEISTQLLEDAQIDLTGIKEPKYGDEPSYYVDSLSSDKPYYNAAQDNNKFASWWEGVGEVTTKTFMDRIVYEIRIKIGAKNAAFTGNTKCTINGREGFIIPDEQDHKYVYACYTFPATKDPKEVRIYGCIPGNKVSQTSYEADTYYIKEIKSVEWFDTDDAFGQNAENKMADDAVFEAGKSYSVAVHFTYRDSMNNEHGFLVNGNESHIYGSEGGGVYKFTSVIPVETKEFLSQPESTTVNVGEDCRIPFTLGFTAKAYDVVLKEYYEEYDAWFTVSYPGNSYVDIKAEKKEKTNRYRIEADGVYSQEFTVTWKDAHQHLFSDNWSSDNQYHWKACGCGEIDAKAAHTAGDWIVDKAAAIGIAGSRHKECSVCGFVMETEAIPALSDNGSGKQQTPDDPQTTPGKEADTAAKPAAKGTKLTAEDQTVYKVTKSDGEQAEVTYLKPRKNVRGKVTIPDDVTIAGYTYKVTGVSAKAFRNKKKVTKITIGKNVRTIGKEAFYGCKKAKTLVIRSTLLKKKKVGKKAFGGWHPKAKAKVPAKKLKAYTSLLKARGMNGPDQKIKKR